MVSTVYAPGSETTAETFVWYRVNRRLKLGVAHLWKQNALRSLASLNVVPETSRIPSVNASVGLQGIGTGNPGYSVTFEKNFAATRGSFNAFVGLGWRSNENKVREVAGLKYAFKSGWTLGLQDDGKQTSPFVTFNHRHSTFGLYLVGGQRLATLIGFRF